MKKRSCIVRLAACALLLLVAGVVAAVFMCAYKISPVSTDAEAESYDLRVPSGMTIRQVAAELEEHRIIRSRLALYLAARFRLFDRGHDFNLKSGLYSLKSSMSLREIYDALQTGSPESIRVGIPEGLTMTKTARELEKASVCNAEEFISLCASEKILADYGIEAENAEGYLFPDTYFFTPGMPAETVLRMLLDTFFAKVSEIDALADKTAAELHDTVILASIVEREYRLAEEAPIIASVFTNRLRDNIGLQSCATIEYIITEIEGLPHPERITYADLKIESPYNTYKWAGLPPGPISNPGLIALKAAAEPADTGYYFFVLTDAAEGRHTFNENFDQHIKTEHLYTKGIPTKR